MWVIKLGGALAKSGALRNWLDVLVEAGGGRVVIAPGGGVYADQVREAQKEFQFSDALAHRMAVLAMEQYALMLCGIRKELIPAANASEMQAVLSQGSVPVWLPSLMLLREAGIAQNWHVSSDSLAAWLAKKIEASALMLVKQATVESKAVHAAKLAERGVVDREFPQFAAAGGFAMRLLHSDEFNSARDMLNGTATAGIRILR
ncbi:MAG: aspartate kinase [Burkholderiales bacterium]